MGVVVIDGVSDEAPGRGMRRVEPEHPLVGPIGPGRLWCGGDEGGGVS